MPTSDASARLTRISAVMREAGDKGNLLVLRRGLRAGAAPLVPAVKEAALRKLPHGGGLNQLVAGRRVTVATRLAGRTASVILKTQGQPGNSETNRGFVRHPVFPRGTGVLRGTWTWVREDIPEAAGWWTETLTREAPKVRRALEVAVDEQARRLNAL